MGELRNCPNCGDIFLKNNLRDLCPKCHDEAEKQYKIIYEYIKKQKDRHASMESIVNGTGISEDIIMRFIRSGRLKVTHFPNLGYECERCGGLIQSGRICPKCQSDIHDGITKSEAEQKAIQGKTFKQAPKGSYFSKKDEGKL